MELHSTGVEIGPITLHFYGLLIVGGILVATTLARWMAQKDGKDPDHIWNSLYWLVIFGMIGARLWFVFFPPITSVEAGQTTAWMLRNFFDVNDGPLAIWNGGLGIFGGVIGAPIGAILYARRHKLKNIWEWGDIGFVVAPFAQAIGRVGNFVNQELYGKPTDLPWGIRIDIPPPQYPNATHFHPLFAYEGLWNLALGGFLLWLWLRHRQRFKAGDFILFYLIGYGVVRFLLEFIRVETAHVPGIGINSSQTATALGVIFALVILVARHVILPRQSGEPGASESGSQPEN
jgi:phosphatidylglycerol:prolipoprotein diacylglycerol transferase